MLTYTEAKEAINDIGRNELQRLIDEGILAAAIECNVEITNIEEAYCGQWDSNEDFTIDLLESLDEVPGNLPGYIHIDWESTARELMMDYKEDNKHYFRIL